jgi:hypothetical protein
MSIIVAIIHVMMFFVFIFRLALFCAILRLLKL